MKGDIPTNADEFDAFSSWRKVLASMQRPGARKKMKRQYHRRSRRTWKPEKEGDTSD